MSTFEFKLVADSDETILDEISCTVEAETAERAESLLRVKIKAAGLLGFDLPSFTQWIIWNQY